MKWETSSTRYEWLFYDGSSECIDVLLRKDLFIVTKDGKTFLREAVGLEHAIDHGEIHIGDTIAIVFDKVVVFQRKGKPMSIVEGFLWEIAETLENIETLLNKNIAQYMRIEEEKPNERFCKISTH